MVSVFFTQNLQRHLACPLSEVAGKTVAEVLDAVFATNPPARGYVLDDRGAVRQHVAIFLNGAAILDRERLSDPVPEGSEIYVMQALSGG
jgi:sulfur carrier protein ThiS